MAKHTAQLTLSFDDRSNEQTFSVAICGVEVISGAANFVPFDCSNDGSVLSSLSSLLSALQTAEG